jgi:hypothetical protein
MQGRWVHGTIIRFRPSEYDRCRTEGIMREKDVVNAYKDEQQG